MFLVIGLLIGLNLFIRIAIGETRELRARGQTSGGGRLQLTPRDLQVIVYRGGLFLLGSVAIGLVLDFAFSTTIGDLLG
jgi:hypothetical protein